MQPLQAADVSSGSPEDALTAQPGQCFVLARDGVHTLLLPTWSPREFTKYRGFYLSDGYFLFDNIYILRHQHMMRQTALPGSPNSSCR